MNNKIAFLFGNGINRTNDSAKDKYEWSNLLEDLNRKFCNSEINNIKKKEFPFVYDEIVNTNQFIEDKEVKEYIKNGLSKLEANSRYSDFKNLKCDEILTTNYDYLFERCLEENWVRPKFISTQEKLYSLNRFQNSANKRIWHIHGEQAMKTSILLGFRHYINYSAALKLRTQNKIAVMKGKSKELIDSWVDLFFTHNIYIVGQGLKFTEYPLWWLLAYRKYKIKNDKRLGIINEIKYVVPSFSLKSNSNLVETLKAYDVTLLPVNVDDKDYDGFYKAVLNNEIV